MAERILITGARAAAALDLARDFKAAGWEVHLADSVDARMVRWSRLDAALHRYSSPAFERQAFRADMRRLVQQVDPAIILPACEEVFHLAAWAEADGKMGRLYAPSLQTLTTLHDKLAFASFAAAAGISAPETLRYDLPPTDPREWVFKPRFSRFGEQVLVGPRTAPPPQKGWLMQRRICGQEACFYAVAHRGQVTAFSGYTTPWRLGGGAGFAFAPLDGQAAGKPREMAQRLAEAAQLTGQFACDAIIDAHGQPHLIECNPRATSGVHLLTGRGDLARAIAEGASLAHADPQPAFIGPAMLAYGLPMAFRKNRLAEWRATMRAGRDVTGRGGDRRAAIGAMLDGARFTASGIRRGITATAATTRDIEWNGEDLA